MDGGDSMTFQSRSPMRNVNDYLTDSEVIRLIETMDNIRDKALFLTLLYTGRRVSEVVRSLKPKDINFKENLISWKILKQKRMIDKQPIDTNPKLLEYLKIYIFTENINTDAFVFPISRQRVTQLLKAYAEKAGINKDKVHNHIFRHTFAYRFMKLTNDVLVLQDLLKHSDLGMTQFYTHFSPSKKKNLIKKMWN